MISLAEEMKIQLAMKREKHSSGNSSNHTQIWSNVYTPKNPGNCYIVVAHEILFRLMSGIALSVNYPPIIHILQYLIINELESYTNRASDILHENA